MTFADEISRPRFQEFMQTEMPMSKAVVLAGGLPPADRRTTNLGIATAPVAEKNLQVRRT